VRSESQRRLVAAILALEAGLVGPVADAGASSEGICKSRIERQQETAQRGEEAIREEERIVTRGGQMVQLLLDPDDR